MHERKLRGAEDENSTITLRRSPRLLQQNRTFVENAATSKTAISPTSISFSLSKTKRKSNVGLRNGERKTHESESLEKCNKWSRISSRSQGGGAQVSRNDKPLVSNYVIERRVTRSLARSKDYARREVNDCVFDEVSIKRVSVLSKEGNSKCGPNLHEQSVGNTEKRFTRSESRAVVCNKASDVASGSFCKVIISDERKTKGGLICTPDQDLGMKRAATLQKRVARRSSLVEFNKKGSDIIGQRLPNVVSKEKKPNRDASRDMLGIEVEERGKIEKRVTRSMSKKSETNEGDFGVKKADEIEKRLTRCLSRKDVGEKASNVLIEAPCEVAMSNERKFEGDESRRDVNYGIKRIREEISCVERAQVGEKRKRHQVEDESEISHGWTKEQELALRRAYFTAKPTPHFWKKVARMVPGKSAEECFDKIQSDHQTPPQPRTRVNANKKKLSPILCSASKLLTPVDSKSKKLKPRKMNVLLAQKTVRQLLQKHQNEDKDRELDLFALFEPTMDDNPSSLNLPECATFDSPSPPKREEPCVLTKCRGTSSSAGGKKPKSRLSNACQESFLSPPVLKQIKNKALHEKYIDQLHRRDAKREAESRRNAKHEQGKNDEKLNYLKENAVKVAKGALVFDALDAVNRLRNLQSDATDSMDEDDNITDNSDEDEEQE